MLENNSYKNKSLTFNKKIEQFLQMIHTDDKSVMYSFLEQLPFVIIMIDHFGKIVFCSKQVSSMFNIETELVGQDVATVLPELELEELLRRDENPRSHLVCHSGKNRMFIIRSRILSHKDHICGAIAFCKPFSEAVQTIERLIEVIDLEKVFKNLIGSAKTAYFITDEAGYCKYVNNAFLSLFTVRKEEVLNKTYMPIDYLHRKALERRRSVFNEPIKINNLTSAKTITGQVAPLLINGKLRGSIGLYQDETPHVHAKKELQFYKRFVRHLEKTQRFQDIVAESNEMKLILDQAKAVANTNVSIIINGEIGTGKKLLAHAIHHESNRRLNQLIHVPCHVLQRDELNDILFGVNHEKGALEKAIEGTLILEEPTEIPLDIQKEIFAYCQQNDFDKKQSIKIITLTTKDIAPLVFQGEFDQQLFYYLNKIPITIPPLRERLADIRPLVEQVIEDLNYQLGRNIRSVDENFIKFLKKRKWKQNISELRNYLEAEVLKKPINSTVLSRIVDTDDKNKNDDTKETYTNLIDDNIGKVHLQTKLDEYEKKIIMKVYEKQNFNKTKTAEALDISLRSLYYKFEKFEID